MNNILNSPNKIIKIVISLGLTPVIFYFAGMLNLTAYYTTLGVSTYFLDFSYHHYIFIGFLNSIIFLFFLPLLLDDYYKAKMEVSTENNNISHLDKFNDKYIMTVSKIIPKDRREKMIQKMHKMLFSIKSAMKSVKFKIFFGMVFLLIILFFAIFFYLKNNFIVTILFLQMIIVFLISFFTFIQIKNTFIEKKKIVNFFSKFFILLFVLFFLLPFCFGSMKALAELKRNNFPKVKIYTKNEIIDIAGLIGMGKGFYFFRTDMGNLFISQDEIVKIEYFNNNH